MRIAVETDEIDQEVSAYANSKKSVFQFPHLVLGAIAIFFYVGAETIVLGTLIDYAKRVRACSSRELLLDNTD